nr:metallophosphoesterase [Leptospira soteropolitanensis]
MGDIHACFHDLSIIMRKIKDFPEHKLIFLGDYIHDNGKHLVDVLDTFMALEKPAIFLKGNHEEEFLNFYSKFGTDKIKRGKILNYFGIGLDHVDWLKNNLVYYYYNDTAYFSHAGIDDSKSLEEQTEYDLIYSAFRENLDHVDDKLIFVQGHIPFHSVRYIGNHWFIDTGCGLGGHLSALVYPELKIISSNN